MDVDGAQDSEMFGASVLRAPGRSGTVEVSVRGTSVSGETLVEITAADKGTGVPRVTLNGETLVLPETETEGLVLGSARAAYDARTEERIGELGRRLSRLENGRVLALEERMSRHEDAHALHMSTHDMSAHGEGAAPSESEGDVSWHQARAAEVCRAQQIPSDLGKRLVDILSAARRTMTWVDLQFTTGGYDFSSVGRALAALVMAGVLVEEDGPPSHYSLAPMPTVSARILALLQGSPGWMSASDLWTRLPGVQWHEVRDALGHLSQTTLVVRKNMNNGDTLYRAEVTGA